MTGTVVSLCHPTDDDESFLEHLFTATRLGEFAALGDAEAATVLAQQFRAQRRDLLSRFDPGGDHVIVEHGAPVGRLWVHCDDTEWELVDIAVLPERQCVGIAGVLIGDLVDQADANAATIRLHVRIDNTRAQRLYFRHLFEVESTSETDLRLRRRPTSERLARFDRVRRAVLADEMLQMRVREAGPQQLVRTIVDVAMDLGLELDEVDVRESRRTAHDAWLTRWT